MWVPEPTQHNQIYIINIIFDTYFQKPAAAPSFFPHSMSKLYQIQVLLQLGIVTQLMQLINGTMTGKLCMS
jgi:hypothetical protein